MKIDILSEDGDNETIKSWKDIDLSESLGERDDVCNEDHDEVMEWIEIHVI